MYRRGSCKDAVRYQYQEVRIVAGIVARLSVIFIPGVCAPAENAYAASGIPNSVSITASYAEYTDWEMRQQIESGTYTAPDGTVYTSADGLETHEGTLDLGAVQSDMPATSNSILLASKSTSVKLQFGSSYASTREIIQYFYKGTAYASGQRDYYSNGSYTPKRVMQVCFVYTQGNKSLTPGSAPMRHPRVNPAKW